MTTPFLVQVETYVVRFFDKHPQPALAYHTLAHTRDVVEATEQLARHEQLPEADYVAVVTAAWFHDLGYLTGPAEQHEERGSMIATGFLQKEAVSPEIIASVQGCIRATKLPQSPTNRLEEMLCDADFFHLGLATYTDRQKLMRIEKENVLGTKLSGRDWRQQNIDLLQQHHYFTTYAQTLLMKGQADNLHRLLEKQARKDAKTNAVSDDISIQPPMPTTEPRPSEKKKDKQTKPERGIETMFRTTSTNHLRLSEIADSKANIMISVNSIITSVIVSVLPRRIEENPHLLIPTTLFLATALFTIVCAILATRPHVTEGVFSREDIRQKKGNLLFFGNFHQLSLADYEWGIGELMQDSQYLYVTMTRDIYYLGQVLVRKYRLLRLSYTIFMVGFVVSILAFLFVFVLGKE